MINSKKKGNKGENKFNNWLHLQNINSQRNRGSGAGLAKSDVHNSLGINFEVKTVKKLNLLKAYRQSERDATMSHTIPYVVIHFDGMPEDNWLVVMNNFDWIDLLKKSQEPKTIEKQLEFSDKYKLERLKQSCSEVLKMFK